MSRRAVSVVAAWAILLTGSVGAVPGLTGATPSAGASPVPASTPVMVVLDASGSMNTDDAPGPRIAAAKRAVEKLITALPSDARIGLEVYGTSTSSADSAKAAGCRDITTLAPVGAVDKPGLTAKVAAIKARGYTPIGNALRLAAGALPQQGPRAIVLVSDGEDTCAPPDPCDVAKQLKRQGVDLAIHTVGFKVGTTARDQLSCIAAATGGSYHDASDGGALSRDLEAGVQRALRPYSVVGTPISGTPTPSGAPRLRAGQYVDVYDHAASSDIGDGTAKYYSVALHKGQTPYLAATVVPPGVPGSDLGVIARLYAPDGTTECGHDAHSDFNFGNRGVSPQTAVIAPGVVGGPDWPTGCPTDATFVVKVTRYTNGYPNTPLKVELAFRLEPPADASGLPGPAEPEPPVSAPPAGPARPVVAGDSFNDATLLTPGIYRDTIVAGETRYYRVNLAWGQRLAYQVAPRKVAKSTDYTGACFARVANPLRAPVRQSERAGGSTSAQFTESCAADPHAFGGADLAAVRYTNRNSKDAFVRPYALDGYYYLSVQAEYPTSGTPLLTISYTLTVQVLGKAERGPVYRPLAAASSATVTPTSATADTATPRSAAPVSGTAAAEEDGGSDLWWIALIVVLGALALLGGAFRWRRRSTTH